MRFAYQNDEHMIKRDDLIDYINKVIGKDLLAIAEKKDEMANGVQFHGGENVEVVTLGVSVNEEFLKKAAEDGSNFSIFHHGFDARTYKNCYSTSSQKRLKVILQNDMTIMGLHYALDSHPEIGHNTLIIKELGAKVADTLFDEWGYVGKFEKSVSVETLQKKCEELFGREIYVMPTEQKHVRTIGVVSGAGKPGVEQMAEFEKKGIELYISGETSESIPHKLTESNITYFLCGHYTTETVGIRALGEKIKKHFKDAIRVQFIDVPNPI